MVIQLLFLEKKVSPLLVPKREKPITRPQKPIVKPLERPTQLPPEEANISSSGTINETLTQKANKNAKNAEVILIKINNSN
jgi:hypothetical protein